MSERLIRRPEVEQLTGLSAQSIYRLMARGDFPKSIPLTERARAWKESDVHQWVQTVIDKADAIA